MCSVGDGFNVEMNDVLQPNNYQCKDCSNEFQGIGKNVKCPACLSKNVELA